MCFQLIKSELQPSCVFERYVKYGAGTNSRDWVESNYMGAFPSKEVFAAKFADENGRGDEIFPVEYDLAELTHELFTQYFDADRDGDLFHVFIRPGV